MPFEWYSGSDRSLEVPRTLMRLEHELVDLANAERVQLLKAVLVHEVEPNWRAFLRSRIARELLESGKEDDAHALLVETAMEFDPLAASFLSVVEEFVWLQYTLIKDFHVKAQDWHAIAVAGMAVLAVLELGDLVRFEEAMIMGYTSKALRILAEESGETIPYSVALPLALRAHHMFPEDEGYLEQLVYLYYHLGRADQCKRVFDSLQELGLSSGVQERTAEFMRKILPSDVGLH
jgi:hypothetical protein